MSSQESLKVSKTAQVSSVQLSTYQNAPLGLKQNTRLRIIDGNDKKKRRYTRSQDLADLAVTKYNANGRGITFKDLLKEHAGHKKQAQETLKRCLQNETLFTVVNHKPQQYFPTCIKAKILEDRMSKNASVR